MKDDECWKWDPNKKSCERKKSHLAGHVEKNSTKVRDNVQQDYFFPRSTNHINDLWRSQLSFLKALCHGTFAVFRPKL